MSGWSRLSGDHRGQVAIGSGLSDSEGGREQAEDRLCYLAGCGCLSLLLVPQA